MTIEEASIIIGNIPINGDGCYSISEYQQAKARAIEALEQKLCEDVVKKDCDKCAYYDNGANNEACDECFADEYEHPNFKPKAQPCNDCISRQAVKEAICDYVCGKDIRCVANHECNIKKLISELPSVTPKEKTGRWISFGVQGEIDGQIIRAFTCSKCGAISIFRVSNGNIVNGDLCPNCGAKMQEVEE